MQRKLKKSMFKSMAILLIILLMVPTVAVALPPGVVTTPPMSEVVLEELVVPVAPAGGITPDELDAMAIDPQSWLLPSQQTWEDDFRPNPIVDWDGYRSELPDLSDSRDFRGALIIVEFPDRPLMTRGPQGAGLMGNPQVAVDVTACPTNTCNTETLVGCDACVAQFWDDFFNTPNTDVNNSITIGGYWLENSFGEWNIELEIYGPFMMPFFEFQFMPTGSFWNRNPTGAFFAGWNFDSNWHFGNQFPVVGWGTGNLGDTNAASAFPIQGTDMLVSNSTFTATIVRAAMEQDPHFIDNFLDDDGNLLYEFIFITGAGYAQTATWQEMGSMMFPVGFGPNHDLSQVAATTEITHPITREVMPGMTGMDFTGYARVRNLYEQVTAPDFVLAEAWPNFFMLDYEAMWRAHVTTNPDPAATGARTLRAAFTSARTAYTTANAASAFAAFREANPGTNLTQAQFNANIFHPQFIVNYAHFAKLAPAEALIPAVGFIAEGYEDYLILVEPEEYWTYRLEEGGELVERPDAYYIAPGFAPFYDAWIGDSPFEALDAQQPVYNQAWLDFYAQWGNSEWVHQELIRLLRSAMHDARTSEVNPYFGAVPSRYVQWSSWYGTAGTWSHANSGFNVVGGDGVIRNLPVSAQSESTGMSTYSHELGHLVGLPDNDNSPYAAIPRRSLQGAWDIMARGTFVGPGGGHTRWMIPATMGASVGAHQNLRGKIANGFTDLTVEGRDNVSNVAHPTGRPVNWVRDDHQNSLDIKYVPYTDFRQNPPVVTEVFGRNIPLNRGFLDYYGNPVAGHLGIVIQGPEFNNRTPAVASNWATNLLPGGATLWDGRVLDENGFDPRTGFRRIDPARWNYMRTDTISNIALGLTNIGPETTFTVGGETRTFGTPGGIPLTGRQHGFTVEVVDRTGYDSFMHDHGVFINRITHTNAPRAGGMENPASFIVDSYPRPLDIVQFIEADGSYYMKADCHYVNMVTTTFHAGVHNNPYYLREVSPESFRADDPRPGVAGRTVNEWVDVHNEFHFYILARNNNRGPYGTFLSYEVGVRSTAPNAYQVGGGLEVDTVGVPTPAAPGNFSRQTFRIAHTGDATATDIIRITLEGDLAVPLMARSPFCVGDDNDPTTWFMYERHTRDQNVVILNNLYAIAPGEVIYFDVFIRVPADHQGNTFDVIGDLEVLVASETNSNKYDSFTGAVVVGPELTYTLFAEDWRPSINIRFFLGGEPVAIPLANMELVVDGVVIENIRDYTLNIAGWQTEMSAVFICKVRHNWEHLTFTVVYQGQTLFFEFTNNMFVPPPELTYTLFAEDWRTSINLRFFIGGVPANIPLANMELVVDGVLIENIRDFTLNIADWQTSQTTVFICKVRHNWEHLTFTVTYQGQTLFFEFINNMFVPPAPDPVLTTTIFAEDWRTTINIRFFLDGVLTALPLTDIELIADGVPVANIRDFTINVAGWQTETSAIFINKLGTPWQNMTVNITAYNQTLTYQFVNNMAPPG